MNTPIVTSHIRMGDTTDVFTLECDDDQFVVVSTVERCTFVVGGIATVVDTFVPNEPAIEAVFQAINEFVGV